MTRVLRRPMFRLGGNTDQGIMSGVVPRQGYAHAPGHVVQNDPQKLGDIRNMTIPQLRELAGTMAYRPTGYTPAQGLIDFGLNLASAEPRGSIFATSADAAKKPFEKYTTSKAESEAAGYVSEADMFKTLIGAQAKILGSEGGSKIFSKQQAADAMSNLLNHWQTLRDNQDTMDSKDFEDEKAIIW